MAHQMQPNFDAVMEFVTSAADELDKGGELTVVHASGLHHAMRRLRELHEEKKIGFLPEEGE
jgi:16S rRNA G1207 methylase RsmC